MGFLSGLLGIGSSIISANAQKATAAEQAAAQQQLEQQAYQQQLQYTNAANSATRQAFTGMASQGNPFLQAGAQVPKPQALAGGSFGGGTYGPGSPMPQGAPQQMPMPQAQGQQMSPAMQQGFMGAPQPQQQQQPQPGAYPMRRTQ